MKIQSIKSHPQSPVDMPGASNARIRLLIGPKDGATNFHMRHFEIGPGGCTPYHQHDYEHEVVVLAGRGSLRTDADHRPFEAGDVIFVPPGQLHQFLNASPQPLELICLIPAGGQP
ncbi:MAG: cupin domain-containing protein [Phycisphaerae bacterium]